MNPKIKMIHTKTISVALLCFAFAFQFSYAQKASFEKILSQDGEANLSVRKIIQDKNGFLWLATFSGLYRYEGDEFIVQHRTRANEQINPDITALLQDLNNNIWIGTNHGLSKYNLETEKLTTYFRSVLDSGSVSSDKIRSLGMDSAGRIFIGTYDSGLNVYNESDDSFSKINIGGSNTDSELYIKSILIDKKGKFWVGTFGDGVYCFNYTDSKVDSVCHFSKNDPINNLSNNNVYCLYQDIDGQIAIGTRNGLNVFNPKTNSIRTYYSTIESSKGEMTNNFRSVKRDKNGTLWLGTWGGIILCDSFADLDSGQIELLIHDRTDKNSISHVQIMDFYEDNSGCIWIGTENGLNKFDLYQNQFVQISGQAVNQLKEQTATAFLPYEDGHLMLTLSHGIIQYNGNKNHFFPVENGFDQFDERLYSFLVDTKNNIWAGSYNGLLIRMDGITQKFTTFRHSSNNTPIYALAESNDGDIIVGTGGEGLKYFNPNTTTFKTDKFLSDETQVNDILIDRIGNLWLATQYGIFQRILGNKTFDYYLPDKSDDILNPNIFNDIEESEKGMLLVGGRNGLYKYNASSNSFEPQTFKDAEYMWVTNIQFDSGENVWLNLNFNRIARLSPELIQFRFFSVNNGTRSSQYNRRGFFIDKDDFLYLSGFDQVYKFDTSKPMTNNYSPNPVFTKLIINNTEVHAYTRLNKHTVLSQNITSQKKIVLDHLNKDFTLWFSTASYVNSRENKYRYILHGYDKNWHEGNERFAHYTNLARGTYTFEVYSANNDGLWSKDSAKLNIKVKPSPFQSTIAILIYLLIIVAVFIFTRRIVLARINMKRELLVERVKRDKEEKFNEERLRFYTNISHELRTPLTLIVGPIKQLISEEKKGTKAFKLQELIQNNSQRLLSLVNQLLDFRKSLYEGMKLKAIYLDIVDIVQSNITAFDYMAKEKSIRVKFTTENNSILGWFDKEKLDIIIFNVLSNAFKYTPENGSIHIDLCINKAKQKYPNGIVELKIMDSGKGIPKDQYEKVFQRFYQVKDNNNKVSTDTGSGIGLAFVKSLVELHHGGIDLESEPGKTCFTITLPLGKDIYSDDELFDFKRDADRRTKELYTHSITKSKDVEPHKEQSDRTPILLIEDNNELKEFLFDYLSEEYDVSLASNGVEGLEVCKKQAPRLVVTDVMMDKMDGFAFCEKLKSDIEISHIPVLLMTALSSIENKITGYKTGADDYITKPFEPELLKIRIENILDNIEKYKKSFKREQDVTTKELTFSKIDEEFLNKVIKIIEDNIDNSQFDIDHVCRYCGVSSSHLYRKIKSITGLSPNEFIRTYRLKQAAKMIAESNLNISEIAYKVGFSDAFYFSKCFKKQFGTSPSRFIPKN